MNHNRVPSFWQSLAARDKAAVMEFAVVVAGSLVILGLWIQAVSR